MARRLRVDRPGMFAHVTNRGLARRPMFESNLERRLFLALLAKQVRKGRIEVLAFALLDNHYHLLLRSVRGELASAMCEIQGAYSRSFNGSRDRDGPLVKGRYHCSPVEDDEYLSTVVRYIDDNVVRAGLAKRARDHRFTSARHYARTGGPVWLARRYVERAVREGCGLGVYDPSRYEEVFPSFLPRDRRCAVESSIASGLRHDDDARALRSSARTQVQSWLEERVRLADGRVPRRAMLDPTTVLRVVDPEHPLARVQSVLLLRVLAGRTITQVARQLGISPTSAHRHWERGRHLLGEEPFSRSLAGLVRGVAGISSSAAETWVSRSRLVGMVPGTVPTVGGGGHQREMTTLRSV